MTAQEIQDIFVRELENHGIREALMNTYYQISLEILAKLARPLLDGERWETLLAVSFSQSRLSLFLVISGSQAGVSVAVLQKKNLEDAVYVFECGLKATTYLYDNFDELDAQEFKEKWTKDQVLEIKNFLAERYQKLKQELEKETLVVKTQEFTLVQNMFVWLQVALLGMETFATYAAEFNASLPALRSFQKELVPSEPEDDTEPASE